MNRYAATADAGLHALTTQHLPPPVVVTNHEVNRHAVIGWTWPSATRDVMDDVHAAADGLNLSIEQHVSDPTFNNAWDAWYKAWNEFYAKNAGRNVAKLFYTDELARTVEAKRLQLEGWYAQYRTQRRPDGSPVPAAAGQSPVRPPLDQAHRPGHDLPWWLWALAGSAVVGIGYLGYIRARELQAKRQMIETKILPQVLEKYVPGMGTELAEVAAARDIRYY